MGGGAGEEIMAVGEEGVAEEEGEGEGGMRVHPENGSTKWCRYSLARRGAACF